MNVAQEVAGYDADKSRARTMKIYETIYEIAERADKAMAPTNIIANKIVEERLAKLGPNPRAFGHPGAGGSVGLADPETRVGFGYVMNQFGSRFADTRATRLVDAVYASL